MNPEYIAAENVHTISEKIVEYFAKPFNNVFIILIVVLMLINPYVLKKLRKIKVKDYITLLNIITIGIYFVSGVISAVLVSRLGPHGTLTVDKCDFKYMALPKTLFYIMAIINIVCFISCMIIKIKNDKEYKETLERGYYSEEAKEKVEKT